jgi:hypothetical protein
MERSDLKLLPAVDALLQSESVTGAVHQPGLEPPAMSHARRVVRAARQAAPETMPGALARLGALAGRAVWRETRDGR